ncbi:dihydroorotase [Denitrobaculum tricleocarpae]|uniref:Dihydroorotase n=1 Tax=Denitrobaculum tricleocarpae TaxID=2591009 RepID=A0A545TXH0_9PROT|nr:dihydroorotase [Denitrobaculum tricleocarpae]TQV81928.1 dihydroorotase [Denitrobaculum tricleocarpae]
MTELYDLVIKGGCVATPSGLVETDVAVSNGRIAALGDLDAAAGKEGFDATGLHVLPGVIDSQVHFREPGLEHKEDLACGTAAAALGGVVAIFEMPNTMPLTLTASDLDDKFARAEGRTWTDHAFFIGAAEENADRLEELERHPGCSGVKIFMGSSTGSLLVEDDETLLRVLKQGTRRVAIHAEDEPRLRERLSLVRGGAPVSDHPVWRDEEVAIKATTRIMRLARQAGRRIHVLHITTADEMPLLAANKDLVTVEVTPQHLTLAAPDCYDRLGSYAQMNPPIRDERHREGLWEGIRQGIVDVIGSDHAPHTKQEKARDYPQSPSGMPGVQTLLPLMLDHVNAGRLSLERLVDLTSAGPARIYNIAGKGRIAVGYDADFSIVDLKARTEITSDWLAYKCGWSPFEGMTVTGWPIATVIRGRTVMRDGELIGDPLGRPVRFQDTLPPVSG